MRTILTLFLVSLFSFAAYAVEKKCELCSAYHAAQPTKPVPTDIKLVCIRFSQQASDNVVLMLFAQDGSTIREYKKTAQSQDEFCIGAQWLTNATKVLLCNGLNHSERGIPSIEKGKETGVIQMCLLGSALCSETGGH